MYTLTERCLENDLIRRVILEAPWAFSFFPRNDLSPQTKIRNKGDAAKLLAMGQRADPSHLTARGGLVGVGQISCHAGAVGYAGHCLLPPGTERTEREVSSFDSWRSRLEIKPIVQASHFVPVLSMCVRAPWGSPLGSLVNASCKILVSPLPLSRGKTDRLTAMPSSDVNHVEHVRLSQASGIITSWVVHAVLPWLLTRVNRGRPNQAVNSPISLSYPDFAEETT